MVMILRNDSSWLFRCVAAWALLQLMSASAQSQPQECAASIVVTVFDEQGMHVNGLKAGDFRVKVDGKDVKVTSAAEEGKKRRAVVLLDTNPGMRSDKTGKWTLAREIATHVLQTGPWETPRFAIFGDLKKKAGQQTSVSSIDEVRNYDFNTIAAGIALASPAVHPSPLFDAIYDGYSLFETPQAGDVIFLVTDGGDAGSKKNYKEVQEALLAAGVRLYAITLPMRYDAELVVTGPGSSSDALQQRENTDFLNMVVNSGGSFLRINPNRRTNEWGFKFTDEERMRMATSLQLLYLQAARVYRVNATLPAPAGAARSKRLEISLTSPANKKLQLRHPRYVSACGPLN